MWASFPDVLNLIFAVFNFANGHRLTKFAKLKSTAKPETYTVYASGLKMRVHNVEIDTDFQCSLQTPAMPKWTTLKL